MSTSHKSTHNGKPCICICFKELRHTHVWRHCWMGFLLQISSSLFPLVNATVALFPMDVPMISIKYISEKIFFKSSVTQPSTSRSWTWGKTVYVNFYFHPSLWYLKQRFMKVFMLFIKLFWGTTKNYTNKRLW